jgi:hypothetical protein
MGARGKYVSHLLIRHQATDQGQIGLRLPLSIRGTRRARSP